METNEKILSATKSLFFEHGIKKVTMDDIAKELGMSKKTIYQYFREKDDLVLTFMQLIIDQNQKELEEIVSKSKNAIHSLMGTMEYSSKQFEKLHFNLFYDLQKYYPESWQLFLAFKEEYVSKMIENNLQRGIQEGIYREDINTPILSRLRIEEIDMVMNPAIFSPERFNLKNVHAQLLVHFLQGIITEKGQKLIDEYSQA